MQNLPQIRTAGFDDLDSVVATLSDAFAHDPVINWLFPDQTVYPQLFRLIVRGSALPRGLVHLADEHRGASIWLPPDTPFNLPPGRDMAALFAKTLWRMGLAPLRRLRAQEAVFARQRPAQPHFHLQFVGCRQRDQGSGIGAALLKTGTGICDAGGAPAYLECSNERNLPLYERHGFETTGEEVLPDGGPRVWFMLREPRQTSPGDRQGPARPQNPDGAPNRAP